MTKTFEALVPPSPPADRRAASVGALLAATICLALLTATAAPLAMAWDEGNAIHRADGIRRWLGRWSLDGPPGAAPLSAQTIGQDWEYTTVIEGHPAGYGIAIAAGRMAAPDWLPPLMAYRLGPMALFSLAAGAVMYQLCRDCSPVAACTGLAALLTMPRLFAHAHFATCDGPLTACWLIAWALFQPAALGRWWWPLAWGAALGATMSCKFTGWFAPLPFIAWTILYRDRAAARAMAVGLPASLAVFVLLNPPLWHHPIDGWRPFFTLNLGRADAPARNIGTVFLGQYHNLDHPLPWYNTLLWTQITVPLGTLLLAGIGLLGALTGWRTRRGAILVAFNWGVLMVVRALPWAPPHDAERLFLPSFAFLAVLAGMGAAYLVEYVANWRPTMRWPRRLALAAIAASLLACASSLAWYAPQWLSYYNLLAGGLRGAAEMGMEPTYFWDGMDREVLDWLHQHTKPGEKIAFRNGPPENLQLLSEWGVLQREYLPDSPGEYRWCVIQHRPSFLSAADQWLIDHETPAFRKTIRSPDAGWGSWKLDVPLIDIYSYEQFARARREAR